ncbi:unnamed protein product [Amoebophrya sp. A120]|nr:unnamed protein product [Amoebophrya sp. A120]|eukprot:GSA120T00025178001.1
MFFALIFRVFVLFFEMVFGFTPLYFAPENVGRQNVGSTQFNTGGSGGSTSNTNMIQIAKHRENSPNFFIRILLVLKAGINKFSFALAKFEYCFLVFFLSFWTVLMLVGLIMHDDTVAAALWFGGLLYLMFKLLVNMVSLQTQMRIVVLALVEKILRAIADNAIKTWGRDKRQYFQHHGAHGAGPGQGYSFTDETGQLNSDDEPGGSSFSQGVLGRTANARMNVYAHYSNQHYMHEERKRQEKSDRDEKYKGAKGGKDDDKSGGEEDGDEGPHDPKAKSITTVRDSNKLKKLMSTQIRESFFPNASAAGGGDATPTTSPRISAVSDRSTTGTAGTTVGASSKSKKDVGKEKQQKNDMKNKKKWSAHSIWRTMTRDLQFFGPVQEESDDDDEKDVVEMDRRFQRQLEPMLDEQQSKNLATNWAQAAAKTRTDSNYFMTGVSSVGADNSEENKIKPEEITTVESKKKLLGNFLARDSKILFKKDDEFKQLQDFEDNVKDGAVPEEANNFYYDSLFGDIDQPMKHSSTLETLVGSDAQIGLQQIFNVIRPKSDEEAVYSAQLAGRDTNLAAQTRSFNRFESQTAPETLLILKKLYEKLVTQYLPDVRLDREQLKPEALKEQMLLQLEAKVLELRANLESFQLQFSDFLLDSAGNLFDQLLVNLTDNAALKAALLEQQEAILSKSYSMDFNSLMSFHADPADPEIPASWFVAAAVGEDTHVPQGGGTPIFSPRGEGEAMEPISEGEASTRDENKHRDRSSPKRPRPSQQTQEQSSPVQQRPSRPSTASTSTVGGGGNKRPSTTQPQTTSQQDPLAALFRLAAAFDSKPLKQTWRQCGNRLGAGVAVARVTRELFLKKYAGLLGSSGSDPDAFFASACKTYPNQTSNFASKKNLSGKTTDKQIVTDGLKASSGGPAGGPSTSAASSTSTEANLMQSAFISIEDLFFVLTEAGVIQRDFSNLFLQKNPEQLTSQLEFLLPGDQVDGDQQNTSFLIDQNTMKITLDAAREVAAALETVIGITEITGREDILNFTTPTNINASTNKSNSNSKKSTSSPPSDQLGRCFLSASEVVKIADSILLPQGMSATTQATSSSLTNQQNVRMCYSAFTHAIDRKYTNGKATAATIAKIFEDQKSQTLSPTQYESAVKQLTSDGMHAQAIVRLFRRLQLPAAAIEIKDTMEQRNAGGPKNPYSANISTFVENCKRADGEEKIKLPAAFDMMDEKKSKLKFKSKLVSKVWEKKCGRNGNFIPRQNLMRFVKDLLFEEKKVPMNNRSVVPAAVNNNDEEFLAEEGAPLIAANQQQIQGGMNHTQFTPRGLWFEAVFLLLQELHVPLSKKYAFELMELYYQKQVEEDKEEEKRPTTFIGAAGGGGSSSPRADGSVTTAGGSPATSAFGFLTRESVLAIFSDIVDFGLYRETYFYFLKFHRVQLPDSAVLSLWDSVIIQKWREKILATDNDNSSSSYPDYMKETFLGQWVVEKLEKSETDKTPAVTAIIPIEFVTDLTAEILLKSGMWLDFAKNTLQSLDVYSGSGINVGVNNNPIVQNQEAVGGVTGAGYEVVGAGVDGTSSSSAVNDDTTSAEPVIFLNQMNTTDEIEAETIFRDLLLLEDKSTSRCVGFLPFEDIYKMLKRVHKTQGMDYFFFTKLVHLLGFHNVTSEDLYDTFAQVEKEERLKLHEFQMALLIVTKERLKKQLMRDLGLETDQILLTLLFYSLIFALLFLFIALVLQSFGPGKSLITTSVQVFFAAFLTFSVDKISTDTINLGVYLGRLKRAVRKAIRI